MPPAIHTTLLDPKERVIIVGDVHGCLDELHALLGACDYSEERDTVILVGDLVNKGPKSPGVVAAARASGFLAVRGNHDDSCLFALEEREHARARGRAPTDDAKHPYVDKLSAADAQYLRDLPYTISLPTLDAVVVLRLEAVAICIPACGPRHPGCNPAHRRCMRAWCPESRWSRRTPQGCTRCATWSRAAPQHAQTPALAVPEFGARASPGRAWRLRVARHSQEARPTHHQAPSQLPLVLVPAASRVTDVSTVGRIGLSYSWTDKPTHGTPWAGEWRGQPHVYFGHDAKRGLQQLSHATGLDTGCCYGRSLSAMVLPERRLVQVPAQRVYSAPDSREKGKA